MGGIFNMTLSLVNLIFALVNFYLIFGRYDSKLRQVAGKVKIAVDEMASRDLHPKVKMGLSRVILPNTPVLADVMRLLKEPSGIFDNANNLLAGQKEARLRKLNTKNEKEEATVKAKSPAAPSSNQPSSPQSNPKSVATETKKEK